MAATPVDRSTEYRSQPHRVDLHTHTTMSDGALSPAQLVALARQRQLSTIAITDHDTLDGIAPAIVAAAHLSVIPGIEISTAIGDRSIHMLGYCIDIADAALHELLRQQASWRRERVFKIVARLETSGLKVDSDQVFAIAGSGSVGRPHVAQALIEAGYVQTRTEAFQRFLGLNGSAYVASEPMQADVMIAAIRRAGGVAVLAHPQTSSDFAAFLPHLIAMGLQGLEVDYPAYSPATRRELRGIAKRYGLVATGGSDFHRPDDRSGYGLGETGVDPNVPEQLWSLASLK